MSDETSEGGSDEKVLAAAVPGEWIAKGLLKPIISEIGDDLARVYRMGIDKLVSRGEAKVPDLSDGRKPNLRVAMEVLLNGSFTEDEVCAEYFGGVLASSRSEGGEDDSSLSYVSAIRSMSSKQLRLHYLLYTELNRLMAQSEGNPNVLQGTELHKWAIFLPSHELLAEGLNPGNEMPTLFRMGLVSEWAADIVLGVGRDGEKVVPYVSMKPTSFGIQLFSAAHNRLSTMSRFSHESFGRFDGIEPLGVAGRSLEELTKLMLGEVETDT